MKSEDLRPVFVPALVVVLREHEREKGRPLTKREVLSIRDRAVIVALPEQDMLELWKNRGYPDIDPENVWVEWQEAREHWK